MSRRSTAFGAASPTFPTFRTRGLRRLVEAGRLDATTDFSVLADADAISICVPTPLRKTKDPDLSYVVAAVEQVAKYLRAGQLVVLESTTYPGTTEEVVRPMLERGGLVAGRDFFLAFSPERVDPANPEWHTGNTPKVVGGIDQASTDVAAALYQQIVSTIVPVSSTGVAEMVKLLENTFRAVNIGLVNELALMCQQMDIDVWEVIDAARTKPFGFMAFLSRARPRRPLHSHRSVLSELEGAAERVREPLHRAGRTCQRVDAALRHRARGRGAQQRRQANQGLAGAPARDGVQGQRRRLSRVAGHRHRAPAGAARRDRQLQRPARAGSGRARL